MATDPPPAEHLTSAAPSRGSRILAFLAVLVGGTCGALIGYGFTDLQCEGSCDTWLGVGTIVGALIGAVGVAVVAVLALRAMDEWDTIQRRDAEAERPRRDAT
jgi:hypothetical protein